MLMFSLFFTVLACGVAVVLRRAWWECVLPVLGWPVVFGIGLGFERLGILAHSPVVAVICDFSTFGLWLFLAAALLGRLAKRWDYFWRGMLSGLLAAVAMWLITVPMGLSECLLFLPGGVAFYLCFAYTFPGYDRSSDWITLRGGKEVS